MKNNLKKLPDKILKFQYMYYVRYIIISTVTTMYISTMCTSSIERTSHLLRSTTTNNTKGVKK